MPKFVKVPVPPTKAILAGMAEATFLKDGSDLEMERRFNGMLGALGKKIPSGLTARQKRLISLIADLDIRLPDLSQKRIISTEVVREARREVDSWAETQAKRKAKGLK